MLSELSPSRTSVPTQYPQTRKLIMVSNRGPIEHWFDDAGRTRRREGFVDRLVAVVPGVERGRREVLMVQALAD